MDWAIILPTHYDPYIYPENNFKAFCTLKTVYESQFQFQTTSWKSNSRCEIKQVQGKNVKLHILNVQYLCLVRATTKIKTVLKALFTEIQDTQNTKLKYVVNVGENSIFSYYFLENVYFIDKKNNISNFYHYSNSALTMLVSEQVWFLL